MCVCLFWENVIPLIVVII